MVLVNAAALIAIALVASRLLPAMLHGRTWLFTHPRTGLTLWIGSLVIGIAALTAATAYVLRAALQMAAHPSATPLDACQCVNAAGIYVLGWVLTALVGGVGSFAVYTAATRAARNWQLRQGVTTALLLEAEQTVVAGEPVLVYETNTPLALGVPGRHPLIAISDSLRTCLDESELAVVVAHERAHLRQHHTVLTQIATLHRACLPRAASARQFESAVRTLVELAADDAAARQYGIAVTAAALRKAAALDPSMALRAERLDLRRRAPQDARDLDRPSAATPAIRPRMPAARPAYPGHDGVVDEALASVSS